MKKKYIQNGWVHHQNVKYYFHLLTLYVFLPWQERSRYHSSQLMDQRTNEDRLSSLNTHRYVRLLISFTSSCSGLDSRVSREAAWQPHGRLNCLEEEIYPAKIIVLMWCFCFPNMSLDVFWNVRTGLPQPSTACRPDPPHTTQAAFALYLQMSGSLLPCQFVIMTIPAHILLSISGISCYLRNRVVTKYEYIVQIKTDNVF